MSNSGWLALTTTSSFIERNVYSTITSSEVILDVSSIRIADVSLSKFEDVSLVIRNKAIIYSDRRKEKI